MTPEEFHDAIHGPAEPEARQLVPEWALLWRGLVFAAVAAGGIWAAVGAVKVSWVLAPVGGVLGAVGVLSAWAAAIHLTGGEKFDDHPFL